MMTDVPRAERSENRIGNRMREHIGIRMPFKSALVGDLDTA